MRAVGILAVFISLPIFISLLRAMPRRRDLAVTAFGALTLAGGSISIDAALVSWPLWPGHVRGIIVSLLDIVALALIITRRSPGRIPLLWVYGLYGAVVALSILSASVPAASAFSFFEVVCSALIFYALAGELLRPSALPAFVRGLSLGLMVQAAFVIVQKAQGVVQAPGTMVHQNLLGMMVEVTVLIIAAAALEGDRRKVVLMGLAAGLVVIGGGGSRAAMGLSVLGMIILLILSLARRATGHKLRITGVAVLALCVAVPFGLGTLTERFRGASFVTEEAERAAFERAARAMSGDYPWGVGANLYVIIANKELYSVRAGVAPRANNLGAPVHNAYLLQRAELGWIGQIAFILLILWPMAVGFKVAFGNRSSTHSGVALAAAVSLFVIALHSGYESAAITPEMQVIIAACLSVISSVAMKKARRNTKLVTAPSSALMDRPVII